MSASRHLKRSSILRCGVIANRHRFQHRSRSCESGSLHRKSMAQDAGASAAISAIVALLWQGDQPAPVSSRIRGRRPHHEGLPRTRDRQVHRDAPPGAGKKMNRATIDLFGAQLAMNKFRDIGALIWEAAWILPGEVVPPQALARSLGFPEQLAGPHNERQGAAPYLVPQVGGLQRLPHSGQGLPGLLLAPGDGFFEAETPQLRCTRPWFSWVDPYWQGLSKL